jgi:ABC-2 type transport system permease protein
MLFRSLQVMILKEWSELRAAFFNWSRWNPATLPLLLMIAAFSIYEPFRIGSDWTTSSIMLFSFSLLLTIIAVGSIIPYSFGGERERHTLEPLLATPISNIAILLGKIIVPTIYGWGMAILNMVMSLLSINLAFGQGRILFYPVNIAIGVIVMSLLISLFIASVGVLASLHAATVMQAQRTLAAILFFPLFIPAFLIGPMSPSAWKYTVSQLLVTMGASKSFIILATILVMLIVVTMFVTLIRFHREKLLLG